MVLMDPKGKVVWITGASAGIGEALAEAMAAAGARLILSARRRDRLESVAARCSDAGVEARVLPLDLAELAALPDRAARAWDMFKRIDILVNNAGVGQRAEALETSVEVDQAIMHTNYLGTVALTKAVLPRMLERGSGQIVVVSSVLGKFGVQRRSAYAASKHALHGFFDSLRCELARSGARVGITVICPGYVHTEISTHAYRGDGSEHRRMSPGQEKGMPAEVFARRMLRAIRRDRDEAVIGGREAWAVLLKRLWPGLLNRLLPRVDED
jgi:short-subunit dehydrogenase